MDMNIVWTKMLEQIKETTSPALYGYWFKKTKFIKENGDVLIIQVEMQSQKNALKDRYNNTIIDILKSLTGNIYTLEYYLQEELEAEKIHNTLKVDNNEVEEKKEYSYESTNLNKDYTFENFVVGQQNKFAENAAMTVAKSPGTIYNPLFIYGNSGLGKTHLMHAIGNYIFKNSNKRVLYVTSEQFIDDFVKTHRKSGDSNNFTYIDFFKKKYRDVDILMIDDIQALGKANQSQQEFFNTFTNLYDNSKQIVITSDRSPNDLKVLEERLQTRFSWGLPIPINPPGFDLRRDILKSKIKGAELDKDIPIPDEVIDFIASNIGSNVRELEGSINRLCVYSTVMGGAPINLALAQEALKDYVKKGFSQKDDIQRIQKIVSDYFQISFDDIRSKKRSSSIAFPRQVAMYLCRCMTDKSFPTIGMEFGGKDHSTVMHSVDKIDKEIKINKDLAKIIDELKNSIGGV